MYSHSSKKFVELDLLCTKQWQKSGPLDIWNWTECISCEISGTQKALLRPAWPWLFFSIQEPQNYEEMSFGALKITRYIYYLFSFLFTRFNLSCPRERESVTHSRFTAGFCILN